MKTILKYQLSIIDRNTITAPTMTVLHVREQNDVPTIWAEVDEGGDIEEHTFWIVGTGMNVPSDATYLGTAFCSPFVWHVYKGD